MQMSADECYCTKWMKKREKAFKCDVFHSCSNAQYMTSVCWNAHQS